jgi:hypothetical protein
MACIAACAAAIVTLHVTRHGPGINVDATVYLSSAHNLAEGNGLRDMTGFHYTIFPPGFPVTVAVGEWLGISAEWTVRLLNAGAFAAAVFLGFVLLRRHVRSTVLVCAATVLMAAGLPLLATAEMAWTEPTFIAICLGLILVLERLGARPTSVPYLMAAVALVWTGFAFRYAGLALVPVAALSVLVGGRGRDLRVAAVSAMTLVALSVIGPAVWMARNHGVDGTYMGIRSPSTDGFWDAADAFFSTLGRWLFPDAAVSIQRLAAVAALLAFAGVSVWWWIAGRQRRRPVPARSTPSLVPLLAFVGIYSGYLFASQMTIAINAINTRLLAPMYVPLVVLGTLAVERFAILVPAHARRFVLLIAVLVLALVFVDQSLGFVREARRASREGASYDGFSYGAPSWQSSDLAAAARRVPTDAILYSNDSWGLWAILKRQPLLPVPARTGYRSDTKLAVPEYFIRAVECTPSYFAAFDRGQSFLYTPEELRQFVDLVVVSAHPDGTLYRFGPRSPSSTSCVEGNGR